VLRRWRPCPRSSRWCVSSCLSSDRWQPRGLSVAVRFAHEFLNGLRGSLRIGVPAVSVAGFFGQPMPVSGFFGQEMPASRERFAMARRI